MANKIENLFGFNCGIYCIKNKINNKLYVGSSSNLQSRKNFHFNSLKDNKHHSKKLQRAYNKYGINNFNYTILENCEKNNLEILEKEWINYFNSYYNGYNATDEVGAPWRGKKLPEKIKKLQKCTPVKMINPNGKIVEDYSISNFCKTNRLHMGAISNVLKGKYFQYKGWRKYDKHLEGIIFNTEDYYARLGMQKKTCKNYKIIDPNGNLIEGKNINDLCRKYNLDAGAILLVLKNKKRHHQGWRIYNKQNINKPFDWVGSFYRFKYCNFSFIHKDGTKEMDVKLDIFCNKYNLKRASVIALINKNNKTHKNWQLYVD